MAKKIFLLTLALGAVAVPLFSMLVTPETTNSQLSGNDESTSFTRTEEESAVIGSRGSSEVKILLAEADGSDDGADSPTDETPKKDCGEGKFLNPKTNRCKNLQTIEETSTGKTITTYDPETGEATVTKVCNDGYELNEETNRCNKKKVETTTNSSSSSNRSSSSSSSSKTTEKTCPEGKFLNPETNRCKNLQTVSESTTGKTVTTYDPETGESTTEKICNEGYELNPDSNRCNKIKENKGEDFALEVPDLGVKEQPNFIAIGSVIATILIGLGFVIFQFRHEIVKFLKGLKFRRKP